MGGLGQRADRYLKVTVTFERRPDGGLRIYSDDVPEGSLHMPRGPEGAKRPADVVGCAVTVAKIAKKAAAARRS